jgi:hypothetical protein
LYRACLKGRGWARAQHVEPIAGGWFRGIEDDDVVRLDAPPPQPASTAVPAIGWSRQAPAPAVKELIGTWTGTLTVPATGSGNMALGTTRHPAILRVVEQAGQIGWALEAHDFDASGTVSASDLEISLAGKFDRQGLPISYTVTTIRGSGMEAVGVGGDNGIYQLTVQKAR